ncbi:DUF2142 domain-containing protein [Microbacterium sp. Leaf320]|uniref:DUF2142 domain-containing protein n=1 Tax=Microbacterium sp. Leaf320 TaxID=1736334 RepID=UPI0006F22138|nr:DUF2142 domain-containing protein [Microbacterium sp. Leaf320]KQQ68804.1 hypothetical protein ASF63_02090 [Microbacterium sp. Leaf320]
MVFSSGPVTARSDIGGTVEPTDRRRIIRVLIVALLGFAALVGWSFASPVGASPDDNFHMTSIWCAPGERPGLCEMTEDPSERAILAEVANSSVCFAFVPEHSGRCDTPPTGLITTGHGNFQGLYPPVYYGTMSIFSSADVPTSVLLMRVFNSFLAVTLVTSIYLLVDRRLRTPMLWGLMLTAIPAGIFLVASVNPSGWAIMSAGTLWVALVGYFRAPSWGRRIALGSLAFVSALMGAGARGDSAVYVAFGAVVAAILSFERTRRYLYLLALPVGAAVMAAAFYLGSNQVGSALEGEMAGTRPESVDIVSGLIRTVMNIPQLWVGNFGTQALGWGDTKMPAAVWFTTLVLYGAVAFWSLSRRRDVRSNVAVVLAGIALVMVPSWVIVQNGVDVGVLVQPRYVLPLQVLLIGLLLFGAGDPRITMSRVQRWIIVIGLAGANSTALYTTMRRYLTGTDYAGFDLNKGIEWWWSGLPIAPGVFWVVGSLAFAALLVAATGAIDRKQSVPELVTDPDLESATAGR